PRALWSDRSAGTHASRGRWWSTDRWCPSSRRIGALRRHLPGLGSCDDLVMSKRPSPSEYSAQQSRYVDLVPEEDVVTALEEQSRTTAAMLSRLSDAEASFRYAPDKWSVKGIVGHVGDSERVFAYRALAI